MINAASPRTAFAWAWLPGSDEPVAVGRLDERGGRLIFGYGDRYRSRSDAISIYEPELPLVAGAIEPPNGLEVANCLLDAGPGAWEQRVIVSRLLGPSAVDTAGLSNLAYLLRSGSERIGALDFQESPEEYVTRGDGAASLEDLATVSELIEAREPVPPALEAALTAVGTAGGARPKGLLRDGERQLIAKFSSLTDNYPIVRGEFLAMRMAAVCGLQAAPVELTSANGTDVLLVERFDRIPGTQQRRGVVSALTLLGLSELAPREASYAKLAHLIRERFVESKATLRELFGRITFNILSGNTDDHARNHSAFWDGRTLTLTPAYDICPYVRGGGEATQAMIIGPPEEPFRFSQVAGCVQHAAVYGLARAQAREIIERQISAIDEHWDEVCDQARLAAAERTMFRRVFPSPYALEGF